MKWHEYAACAVLMLPTVVFVAMALFYLCEPMAGTFQRRRGMGGG